ncbi:hypothetical protein [Mesorhizobium qingshengii]|uniref:hypothetical protein n=1 Tax=Mesorhizobium qingshengii TaxID=1165689 RepID=UPI0014289519|nr:hypothetical protein [Mesorhizobium qingshengii]
MGLSPYPWTREPQAGGRFNGLLPYTRWSTGPSPASLLPVVEAALSAPWRHMFW